MITGAVALGDELTHKDGRVATVLRLELRGGEHWAQLNSDDWVKLQPHETDGDEQTVVDLVADRLALGREQYGPLTIGDDSRDFTTEALEELLDGCVYLACELLRRKKETTP